jgi:carboxyl-terminal processing protease
MRALLLFNRLQRKPRMHQALIQRNQATGKEQGNKLNALLYHIESIYVEDVDMESLVEVAIINMLEEMDPHSVYIPAEELQAADEPLNGNFEGVGIQFNIFRDTIMVVSPISGGPSEKARNHGG